MDRAASGIWTRRALLATTGLLVRPLSLFPRQAEPAVPPDPEPEDWICPMDPDYHSSKPGACPRCGMKLRLKIPERREFPIELSHTPALLTPSKPAVLNFKVVDPATNHIVRRFQIVHEKLMHTFLVSQDLEYFAHVHPVLQPDGTFRLPVVLPKGGMYRILDDFYPFDSTPQLAVQTLFVSGKPNEAKLQPDLVPQKSDNLSASIRFDPPEVTAGLESKLFFSLNPAEGLEPYLGAWAHMLAASEDLIDLLHMHPFLADSVRGEIQFNTVFPRPGLYRFWTQFQRSGVVNTFRFTVPVKPL